MVVTRLLEDGVERGSEGGVVVKESSERERRVEVGMGVREG